MICWNIYGTVCIWVCIQILGENFHNSTTKIGANSLVMHTLVYEPAKLYVNYEVVFCLCCHPFLAVVTWPVSQPR